MYLSTLMLTGQGGPEGDLPWYTKGVVLMTSAFSIGMFAIPVSMLTWGFEAEAERCAKRTRALQKRDELRATGEYDGSSTEDYSTDEEYQKIIAGEDADADNEDDEVKEALKSFLLADADSSGSINLKEYIQISRSNKNKPVEGSMNGNTAALTDRLDRLEEKVDGIAEKLSMLCDKLATANL